MESLNNHRIKDLKNGNVNVSFNKKQGFYVPILLKYYFIQGKTFKEIYVKDGLSINKIQTKDLKIISSILNFFVF